MPGAGGADNWLSLMGTGDQCEASEELREHIYLSTNS